MMPRRAGLLSIGDELVLGTSLDTNSRAIALALRDVGVEVVEHRTVADDLDAIVEAMRAMASRHDVLVSTGGLGPTDDDLTRDALNVVLDDGAPQVEDADARADLEAWFAGRGRPMAGINLRQSLRPRSARIVRNREGTAPGLAASVDDCRVWCLPGPPREMLPMLEADVLAALRTGAAPEIVRRGIGTYGIGESALAERLGERMARGREPAVGTTASGSVVTIQVVARGADAADRAAEEVRTCAAVAEPWTFGTDDATLASSLLELCRTNRRTLAVAESCTGGLVGAMLTAVAGSSDVFMGGWITYANAAKHRDLGVPMALLATHGAVSAPVVEAMARGACARAEADVAIAISGIAGPGGASDGKPVGTVWIAVHDVRAGECRSRRFVFPGVREVVRDRAAKSALQMARWSVLGRDGAMIWEQR